MLVLLLRVLAHILNGGADLLEWVGEPSKGQVFVLGVIFFTGRFLLSWRTQVVWG
jgi:hypothetical protein